jgi:hypothetical protein
MGIPLKIVEPFPDRPREPGSMWRYPEGDIDGRECWWIVLPPHADQGTPGHPSEISWRTTDRAADPPHQLWDVTGTAPNLTVTPSIDVMRDIENPARQSDPSQPAHIRDGSYWHGFITNGELVDA